MAIVLLHVLHAGIVIVGGLVVLVLVRPGADHRRVAQLRGAASRGELVGLARARARAELMPAGAHRAAARCTYSSLMRGATLFEDIRQREDEAIQLNDADAPLLRTRLATIDEGTV